MSAMRAAPALIHVRRGLRCALPCAKLLGQRLDELQQNLQLPHELLIRPPRAAQELQRRSVSHRGLPVGCRLPTMRVERTRGHVPVHDLSGGGHRRINPHRSGQR